MTCVFKYTRISYKNKMKIWLLKVDFRDYESLQLVNREEHYIDEFRKLISKGEPLNGRFDDTKVEILKGETLTDHPIFWDRIGTSVLSKDAKDVLFNLIKDDVEIIPLNCEDREFYMLNIVKILDAIDYEKSEFERLIGKVVGVEKYELKEELLSDVNIFKLFLNGHVETTSILVSSLFKETVEKSKLKGFKFIEVWDSDKNGSSKIM